MKNSNNLKNSLGKFRKRGQNWRKEKADAYKSYVKTSAVGLEVGLSLLVGVSLGFWLDRWLGIEPWGILLGTLVGAASATKTLISVSKKYIRENQDSKNGKDDRNDKSGNNNEQ